MKFTTWCLAASVLAAMVIGGCTQFTRQNYERIQTGDDRARVKDVMGKPFQRGSELWVYVHRKPFYQAKIHFDGNQVVNKEWFDEEIRWAQPAE